MKRLIFSCAVLCLSACTALYVPTDSSGDGGGAQDAGPDEAGPDAGDPPEPTTPVSCPIPNERPCGTEKVVCGWDSTQAEHVASLRSGLFQVKGLNPVDSTLGSEILVTFRAPMAGAPLLVGFSLHRNSSSLDDATHKLFADIIPMNAEETKPVIPANGESPLASASYDIMNARRDADTPVSLVFDSVAATTLVEGRVYALYFHVDSSTADEIALVGHNALTDNVSTVFQRISYFSDEGDLTYTPWMMAKQKSLNYFVTVGGRTPGCSDPWALMPIYRGVATCWTDVAGQCPNVNGVSGLCSMDPNVKPYEPVWPSLFQVIGYSSDLPEVAQDNSLAVTFSGARGVPLSLQLVLRRLSSLTSPDSHELVAEVIPAEETRDPTTGQGPQLHWKGSPVATGRFDLSTVSYSSEAPVDRRISLNFKASQGAIIDPNQTYGVYLHVAPGATDRLGMGGTESDVNSGTNVYTRKIDMPPLSAESGLWSPVANRELDFSLTFADVCGD